MGIRNKKKFIQQQIKTTPMTGYNSFSKYYYPFFSDIINTLAPLLDEAGIDYSFSVDSAQADRTEDGKRSKAEVVVSLHLYDVETDESLTYNCPGYAEDTNDKCLFQAITGAKKYVLLNAFGLTFGDDPESTPSPEESQQKKTSPSSNKSKRSKVI